MYSFEINSAKWGLRGFHSTGATQHLNTMKQYRDLVT